MIRHVAAFRFSPEKSEKEIQEILSAFGTLPGQIDGLLDVHFGANITPENLDQGYLHGIILDFDSIQSLKAYLEHPEHIRIAGPVLQALSGPAERSVVVFDLVLSGP